MIERGSSPPGSLTVPPPAIPAPALQAVAGGWSNRVEHPSTTDRISGGSGSDDQGEIPPARVGARYGSTVTVQNAPGEGLPPGCSCVLMVPGTTYEARVSDPGCRVHNPASYQRGRVKKFHAVTRRRNGY